MTLQDALLDLIIGSEPLTNGDTELAHTNNNTNQVIITHTITPLLRGRHNSFFKG